MRLLPVKVSLPVVVVIKVLIGIALTKVSTVGFRSTTVMVVVSTVILPDCSIYLPDVQISIGLEPIEVDLRISHALMY